MEFNIADLAMMAHAMRIARNSQFGTRNHVARERADAIAKQIASAAPTVSRYFDDAVFCELVIAVYETPEPTVEIERPSWRTWGKEGFITVTAGERKYRSANSDHIPECAALGEIRDFIAEISPIAAPASPAL
jgi:hypothetical protein